MPREPRYFLVKSEPDVFSIDALRKAGRTPWEGVRNYQARNTMRDDMKLGDKVLYYHSNTEVVGIVGVAEVVREAYPDPFALQPGHDYFDAKSTPENNRWVMVDLGFVEAFPKPLSLATIKADPVLSGMTIAQKGTRLSVSPVEAEHFERAVKLGRAGK